MPEVEKILSRDNVVNTGYKKLDQIKEKEFDDWFSKLDKGLQNSYLKDNNLLNEAYKNYLYQRDKNFVIDEAKDAITNMYPTVIDGIEEDIKEEISSYEGASHQLSQLLKLKVIGSKEYHELNKKRLTGGLERIRSFLVKKEISLDNIRKWKNYHKVGEYFGGQVLDEVAVQGSSGIGNFVLNNETQQIYETYSVQSYNDSEKFNISVYQKKENKFISYKEVEGDFIYGYDPISKLFSSYSGNFLVISNSIQTPLLQEEGEYMYLNEERSLSRQDFLNYFSPVDILKQGEINDCYLVILFNAMQEYSSLEGLLGRHINFKKDSNGNFISADIILPLGKAITKNSSKITVTKKNLEDDRLLDGPLGYKMLEIALIKSRALKNGVDYRSQTSSDEHFGIRRSDHLNTNLIDWGNPTDIAYELLGKSEVDIFGNIPKPGNGYTVVGSDNLRLSHGDTFKEGSLYFTSISEDKTIYDNEIIKDIGDSVVINYEHDIALQSTKAKIELFKKHSYQIVGYDSNSDIIELVNPHDTSSKIKIPYSIYSQCFTNIQTYVFPKNF